VLAFPVYFTAFEYLLFVLSRDGTAASIAYTQSNYLPVIQIASVTGILGISFLISFFPSAIALSWYFRKNLKMVFILTGLLIIIFSDLFIYGWIRLKKPETGKSILIGMATIDEKAYKGVYQHEPGKEMQLTDLYLKEISGLADRGAKVILLPEKAVVVNDSTIDSVLNMFKQLAVNRKIQIIIGGTRNQEGYYLNNAWYVSDQGNILADYQKVNLFEGEVLDGCKPGNKIAVFSQDSIHIGVAICKDMDFQQFILGYSKKSPAIMYVPAWDFVTDGWMHARMAILRSVEGGFSLARNARDGRLTMNDWRGKVLYEASSESGNATSLTGKLSVEPHPTVYARAGDWFGTVNVFAALGFIVFMITKRKRNLKRSMHS
jgi:apolipoprotein N-acyltransferase